MRNLRFNLLKDSGGSSLTGPLTLFNNANYGLEKSQFFNFQIFAIRWKNEGSSAASCGEFFLEKSHTLEELENCWDEALIS